MPYDITVKVNYSNNTEYRDCIRRVFRFDTQNIIDRLKQLHPDYDTYEDETKDELIFDECIIDTVMGELASLTMEYTQFRELYRKAASFMISLDLEIGLAILMSYDYFQDFHAVLVDFIGASDKNMVFDNSDPYKRLYMRLSSR